MDPRISPVWNYLFLACVAFCAALWPALAARESASPAARRRALGVSGAALLVYGVGAHALASTGVLSRWDLFPPPAMRVFLPLMALAAYLGLGPVGRFLGRTAPPALLVGAQAFRVPLELALHGFYEGGAIPIQMTFEGRNFDIFSGLLAVPVAALLARGKIGRRGVLVFNFVGLALLFNIVGVALLSMPTPLRAFEGQPNTLVVQPFYVWLPTVLVQTALALHLASLRGAWRAEGTSGA